MSNYQLGFTITSPQTIGSIELMFCANSPLQDDPCVPPNGLSVNGANLVSQTGITGFNVVKPSPAHILVLGRTPSLFAGGAVSFDISGIVNPTGPGTYYGRIQTFPSPDVSGVANDFGGLAFSIGNAAQVSATVPPYLLFCTSLAISDYDCAKTSGNYTNFGNFSPTKASIGQSEMVSATNAGSGFTIQASGPTLTSGNNVIPALSVPDVSRPGTSQFGINLRANIDPAVGVDPQGPGGGVVNPSYNIPNEYVYNSGDVIVSFNGPEDYRKFTVSYIVNIAKSQPVGVYATTLSYIALANF